MHRMFAGMATVLAAALATPLAAQGPPLVLPKASPRATVSQQIALAEISITYDRPAVGGRDVWGALVPFDTVWRAGANENTVIAFTSPVRVAGQEVAAGRYGLHMIPSRNEWTIILSRQANQWGSFSYDPNEDALRVKTTPVPVAEPQERLAYTFDAPGEDSVVATLRWEKLAVPIPIAINAEQVVVDSLRQQLRGLQQFFWQPWSQAAAWCAAKDVNLEEATEWAQRSIALQENFNNLRVKALLLEKRGDVAGAEELRRRAFTVAVEADWNAYGYMLLGQDKVDSAIAVFRKNVKDYPRSWNTYDSLGEALAKKGDKKRAVEAYTKARQMTGDPNQRKRIDGILATLT
jgi:tetratricopeptide (TPR) repeat protein